MKKIVFVDMDDTIADFQGSHHFPKDQCREHIHEMYNTNFFLSLKVIKGALVAVRQIIRMGYDVQILSQPLAESAHSYSEKVQWIGLHFPELISKINFTQDKGLFRGDYLIDDNPQKWKEKFEANGGKFIHFDYTQDHEKNWKQIAEFLKNEKEKTGI